METINGITYDSYKSKAMELASLIGEPREPSHGFLLYCWAIGTPIGQAAKCLLGSNCSSA